MFQSNPRPSALAATLFIAFRGWEDATGQMKQFKDAVKLRKLKLIEDKVEAGEVKEAAAAAREEATGQKPAVIDLMAALKASLGAAKPARGASASHAAKAVNRRRRTRSAKRPTGRSPSRKSA